MVSLAVAAGTKNEKSRQFFGRRSLLFCLIRLLQYNKKDYFARAAHGTITVKLTYLFDLKK